MVKHMRVSFFNVIVYTILTLFCILIIVPILYVVVSSVTPFGDVIKSKGMVLIPSRLTFEGYVQFFEEPKVYSAYRVTSFVSIVGTTINLILTTLMAYPLSKKNLPYRRILTVFVTIPLVLNGGMIPTYIVVKSFHLINSIWAMIIPAAIWSYNLIIMRSFFSSIDDSYFEAAKLDGASEFYILTCITIPLSMPVIATLTLFYGVGNWNQFMSAVLYINDPNKLPLQVVLRNIIEMTQNNNEDILSMNVSSHNLKMAAVVMTAVPIIIVYPFLQKHFTQGVMLGGIKG